MPGQCAESRDVRSSERHSQDQTRQLLLTIHTRTAQSSRLLHISIQSIHVNPRPLTPLTPTHSHPGPLNPIVSTTRSPAHAPLHVHALPCMCRQSLYRSLRGEKSGEAAKAPLHLQQATSAAERPREIRKQSSRSRCRSSTSGIASAMYTRKGAAHIHQHRPPGSIFHTLLV